jgi:hypothetical protein
VNWLESHGKIIYGYVGNGHIEHETGQSSVSFQVAQFANGKILCECEGGQDIGDAYFEKAKINRLIGHSSKYEIVVTKLMVVGFTPGIDSSGVRSILRLLAQEISVKLHPLPSHGQLEEMRFALTNLEFVGFEPYTEIRQATEVGQFQLHWELDGCTVIVRPLWDYKENVEIIKATQGIGTTAIASVSAPNALLDAPKAINLMDDLCFLFTLARGCGVQWLYRESVSRGQVVERYHWNPITLPYTMYELIPTLPRRDLKYFIDCCFDPFRQKKKDWQLKKVVHMYTGAKVRDFVESRALKLCVLIDFLRGIYLEMHSKTYLVDKNDFDQVIKPLKSEVKETLHNLFPDISLERLKMMVNHVQGFVWYPLRRSMKEMCQEMGLKVSRKVIDRFVTQRNELTHRGRFIAGENSGTDTPEKIFREMMTLVGQVVLAILEYDGRYYDWTKPPGSVGGSEMRVEMPLYVQKPVKITDRQPRSEPSS